MLISTSVFVALLASLAHGAAIPEPQGGITIQEFTSMTACTDTYNGGACKTWSIQTQTQCIGLSGTDWNDVISSIQVPNGFRCRLWSSNVCNGDSTPDIYAPGAGQLPNSMNDKTTSFKCYRN
ncbi:hypothetical protein P153DRAFT_360240 [Dothidotthia symphoricarpi CBS 119687]|uniref:Uncharacterized protein n=1 Tax=Dothidotthia symphoricarpi CBS 119687 TaxID=1392245 RepID=A0A6A6A499_9PLEO|nr:uncharacterized protein P153DRAFT_360240 [Dothidotthia symphoricarpi CBS 119687]KAF2125944.1 hypothetical protein P153DRAFT_360240 [Dothidotthia symphoricarpi CBS 119687]